MRTYLLLIALLATTGCATVVDPGDLKRPLAETSIHLNAGYAYVGSVGGYCGAKIEYKLVPGSYVAELEDKNGTFFRGPGKALKTTLLSSRCGPPGLGMQIEAGIYVPADQAVRPWIYIHNPKDGLADAFVLSVTYAATHVQQEGQVATPPTVASDSGKSVSGAVVAGVGVGIGVGFVGAIIASEYNKMRSIPYQPKDQSLQSAISR